MTHVVTGCSEESNSNGAMFQANLERTGVYPTNGYTPSSNIAWTREIDGIPATPVVTNDTIVVAGGSTNPTDEKAVYAFDVKTGKIKWRFTEIGLVAAGPAVAGSTVYVGDQDEQMYALDVNSGEVKWKFTATEDIVMSSPAVSEGTVYFGTFDGSLYALDATSGEKEWRYEADGALRSPAVSEGVVYVTTGKNKVYAIDAATGEKTWSLETDRFMGQGPTVSNGVLYFLASSHLYKVSVDTGEVTQKVRVRGDVQAATALSIHDQNIVFGTCIVKLKCKAVYHSLDVGTLKENWSIKAPPRDRALSSLAIVNENVYFGSGESHERGALHAVDLETGNEMWELETEKGVLAAPAISEKALAFGTAKSIYVLN